MTMVILCNRKGPFYKKFHRYTLPYLFSGFWRKHTVAARQRGPPLIVNQLGMSDISGIVDESVTEEQMVLYMTHLAEMRALHLSKISKERQFSKVFVSRI